MGKREQRKASADQAVRDAIKRNPDWISAKELARSMGWSWQMVESVLRRLALRGDLRVTIQERKMAKSRIRQRRIYLGQIEMVRMPSWLEPGPPQFTGVVRVVRAEDDHM